MVIIWLLHHIIKLWQLIKLGINHHKPSGKQVTGNLKSDYFIDTRNHLVCITIHLFWTYTFSPKNPETIPIISHPKITTLQKSVCSIGSFWDPTIVAVDSCLSYYPTHKKHPNPGEIYIYTYFFIADILLTVGEKTHFLLVENP